MLLPCDRMSWLVSKLLAVHAFLVGFSYNHSGEYEFLSSFHVVGENSSDWHNQLDTVIAVTKDRNDVDQKILNSSLLW